MSRLARWHRREQATGPLAVPGPRRPPDAFPAAGPYADFQVLLDSPAEDPGLGFRQYATALAEMILSSPAEFAVGIFGSWGSGKTTLMQAIRQNLTDREDVVPVWFTAWRYEKDPNLLLPLLDVLREALEQRADGRKGWAHDAAAAVGRAGQAFLAGLTITTGPPGFQAGLELSKVLDTIRGAPKHPEPLSHYHAGFRSLSKAISGLSGNGARRVVIFVDDLDRCLPPSALDVLESMKMFFDEEGCVFVVGLDQQIAELAVAEKYGAPWASAGPDGRRSDDGRGSEYVKKLFQVPVALPGIRARELPDYLDLIERGLSGGQRRDFRDVVRPHFRSLPGDGPVNPREIKRLLNMYTLQLKVLSARPDLTADQNVVLALLCLNFRRDWRPFFNQLAADPAYTRDVLRAAVPPDGADQPAAVWLGGDECALTTELAEYLRGPALALLETADLQQYVSAAESAWLTDREVLRARVMISGLRRAADDAVAGRLTPDARARIEADVDQLSSLIISKGGSAHGWLAATHSRLLAESGLLRDVTRELGPPAQSSSDEQEILSRWAASAAPLIKDLDEGLLAWHRHVGLGL